VLTLVERKGGARSFKMSDFRDESVRRVLVENSLAGTRLMSDEGMPMFPVGQHFERHETVKHTADEYVRGDVTSNTVESFFALFKRGMRGTYQHCGSRHLQRYLDEFDFRYSNRAALGVDDTERAARAVKGAEGSASRTGNLVQRNREQRALKRLQKLIALLESSFPSRRS